MPRSKLLLSLPAMLIVGALFWYVWMLVSTKLEWGGSSPGQQTLGTLQHIQQRAMEQYCTGVLSTARGTWLVGRVEDDFKHLQPQTESIDLNALVRGKPKADPNQGSESSGAGFGLRLGRDSQTTYISRLDSNGQFQLVAHINEAACLVASPDGSSLFLLTGLDRPQDSPGQGEISQTVVLRSDDQGQSWKWLSQGLFPKAETLAWSLDLYFHGQDEIWAWGRPQRPDPQSSASSDGRLSSGVFYSADRGASSQEIFTDQPLLVDREYVRSKWPESKGQDSGDGGEIESKTHVTQLDARRGLIWVSQRFWAADPGHEDRRLLFNVTTRAQLQLDAGQWRVVSLQRDDGLYLDELVQSPDGKVVGLVDLGNQGQQQIAQLDIRTLAWQPQGSLPSVFSPLSSSSQLREHNFWAGNNSLVINTSSTHNPPRWLYWGQEATVSADGVFYSKDWGRSWQRLAVDGYLGALGFQGTEDRLFWAKGNWYNSNDLKVYAYGLQ